MKLLTSILYRFYIRSKSDPRVFWKVESGGNIHASQSDRTRFRMSIIDKKNDGTVMISSDPISISLVSDENAVIACDQEGGLFISRYRMNLTFGDLKKILAPTNLRREYNRITRNVDGGEEWELVA